MNKKILAVLFIVIIIDQCGLLIVAPLLPDLLAELTAQSLGVNSTWAGWLTSSYALTQFIVAPFIGQLSDRYGRKPILICAMLMLAADYIILILAANVWILFIGRLLAGIPGASIVTAMAAVTDISSKENRVRNFSLMYGAVGLGLILGPALAGILFKFGLRIPFYFAGASCLVCVLLITLCLPETLKTRGVVNQQHSFANLVDFSLLKRAGLQVLFFAQFICMLAFQAPMVLWTFFVEQRFNWDATLAGYSISIFGILYVFVQLVVVRYSYPVLKTVKSIYVGLGCFIVGLLLYAVTTNLVVFFFSMLIYSIGAIASGSATNLFAANVADDEQGKLQGLLSSVNSFAAIIGPFLMSWTFRFDVEHKLVLDGGLVFVLAAVLLIIGGCFYYLGIKKSSYTD